MKKIKQESYFRHLHNRQQWKCRILGWATTQRILRIFFWQQRPTTQIKESRSVNSKNNSESSPTFSSSSFSSRPILNVSSSGVRMCLALPTLLSRVRILWICEICRRSPSHYRNGVEPDASLSLSPREK